MAIISWRMLTVTAACLIAVSLGSAIEMYDEMPPGDMNLMYQENNYIEPGPQASLPEESADNTMRNFLLYKMLSSFRNQDVSPSVLAGPKWLSSDTVLVPPETLGFPLLKESIMKRVSGDSIVPKIKGVTKPAGQKSKTKTRRWGSHIVCYMKYCAIRPPW